MESAMASKRSVSCPRRCAIPLRVDGVCAKSRSAARVGTISPIADISQVIPWKLPGPSPWTSKVPFLLPVATKWVSIPMRSKSSGHIAPGCVELAGQCGIARLPPLRIPAHKKGPAFERSASILISEAVGLPSSSFHSLAPSLDQVIPVARIMSKVMLI